MVIFNTGHNYVTLINLTDFRQLARRMLAVVQRKGWLRWTLLKSPAMYEAGWRRDSLCTHNNVRVQMTNTILSEVFPARHTVDMFWRTLLSGSHTDGVHYTDAVYGPVLEEALDGMVSS